MNLGARNLFPRGLIPCDCRPDSGSGRDPAPSRNGGRCPSRARDRDGEPAPQSGDPRRPAAGRLLARRAEEVLTGLDGSTVVPVTLEVARHAARLRAAYGLRTPDAIHLATAVAAEAAEFVTTDRRLARVKEIEVRVLKAASKVSKR